MKLLIKIFVVLILSTTAVSQTNSIYKFVEITDDKAYFLKYSNIDKKYYESIVNGNITFSLQSNNKNIEFYCGEKGCFFISLLDKGITDSGVLSLHQGEKTMSFPYEITFRDKKSQEKKIYAIQGKNNIQNNNIGVSKNNGIDISERMYYKSIQQRALSCEISATADILSYLMGTQIKEDYLLPELPKSDYNKLPTIREGKKYWGDPQSGFVGYIDTLPNGVTARQRYMTGYGVLEFPIEKIINKYGFKTKVISQYNYLPNFSKKEHLSLILKELEKGNMVQLWGDICTNPEHFNGKENPCSHGGKPTWDSARKISWYYKDATGKDKKYTGLNGEHAFYLLGYKGELENPSHIIVWDTYTGKHTYPTSEWMRKWKKMQYRSIIAYAK